MVRRTLTLLACGLAVAVLVAACGGSSGSGSSTPTSSAGSIPAGAHVVEIDVASQGLAFAESSATVKSGPVVIRSKNPQSLSHDISLKGNGVDQQGQEVSNGGTSTLVFADLKPGTYEFYCSVPGHEAAGMKGTLTVT